MSGEWKRRCSEYTPHAPAVAHFQACVCYTQALLRWKRETEGWGRKENILEGPRWERLEAQRMVKVCGSFREPAS